VATLTLKPEPPKAQGTAKRGKPVLQQQAERPVDGKNPRDISCTGRHLSLPCKRENRCERIISYVAEGHDDSESWNGKSALKSYRLTATATYGQRSTTVRQWIRV
jgi:hypothetical protein